MWKRKRKGKRAPRKLPHIPADEDIRKLIDASKIQRDRLMLLLMYSAGLRVSEVVKLRVDHLDFSTKQMFLSQAKGSRDAYLPIPKHLVGPLRGWVGIRKTGPLFMSRKGGHLVTRAIQHLVKRLAVKAGLFGATEPRRFHPHALRHSCATNLMRQKVPLPIIQRILRHSNLNTTMLYLDVVPEDLREALDG